LKTCAQRSPTAMSHSPKQPSAMSDPPAFTGSDSPNPPSDLFSAAELSSAAGSGEGNTVQQLEEVTKADEQPPSPGKSQLRDWEILNGGPETKMQVKDIPRQMKEQVKKLRPSLEGAGAQVMEKFVDLGCKEKLEQCWKRASAVQGDFCEKYPTDEVLKAALAVALLFAGGRFSLTIACAQSFHMACWQKVKRACQDVQDSYISASGQKSLQDASLSSDIARVIKMLVLASRATEADREEAQRRSQSLVKCIDPYKTRDVLYSLWPGVLAVMATLRSRFALAASLGANVGQIVCEAMQKGSWLEQRFKQSWTAGSLTDVGLQQACSVVSFCFSFYMAQVMNSLNSALQGSSALTKLLFQYIAGQKCLPESSRSTIGKCALPLLGSRPETGKEEEMVKWGVAMIGFYVQVRRQHQYPLPLKVPMAPLYLMEYCLARLASTRSF